MGGDVRVIHLALLMAAIFTSSFSAGDLPTVTEVTDSSTMPYDTLEASTSLNLLESGLDLQLEAIRTPYLESSMARVPRTASPDPLGTAGVLASRSPSDLRRSDPEPGIDEIIEGIAKLLAGAAKHPAADDRGSRPVPSSSRINNRGPPRLEGVHLRPHTPAGRPHYVANTLPPFPLPLPPALNRPFALPLPLDLLEGDLKSQGVAVDPDIPGLQGVPGGEVARRPTTPTPTLGSSSTPTRSSSTPTAVLSSTLLLTTWTSSMPTPTKESSSTPTGSSLTPTKGSPSTPTLTPTKESPSTPTLTPTKESSSTPTLTPTMGSSSTPTLTPTKGSSSTPTKTSLGTLSSSTAPVAHVVSSVGVSPTPTSLQTSLETSTTIGGRPPTTSALPTPTRPPTRPSTPTRPPPRPSAPTRPPTPARPGTVLDVITGTAVPYDFGGSGDVFDVTVSAHQGFGGGSPTPPGSLVPPPGSLEPPPGSQPEAPGGPLVTKASSEDGFVSIDGRKTYFDLFPTATQALTPQTAGMGVGVVIPEEDLPPGEGYHTQVTPTRPRHPTPRPQYPTPPPRPPTPHPRPPTIAPTRPTRKPYTRRPTQPPIRIDTCIVGDDSTCQEKLGEVCRTEEEVSSCFCRAGTARRRPRTPCKRMVSLQVSLKVDRVGDHRIVWGSAYRDPESEEFKLLKWEARHAISDAMSKTPLGSAYLGNAVHKFYSLGGKVIVNSTVNLEDRPTTRNREVRQALQRQIIQVIQGHSNNIGNSALWVDGPLNPVPDVSDVNECGDASLHNCHTNAVCINRFGTFTCRCLPGYTDRFTDDPEQVGRQCESCSSDYCNKRGECSVEEGQKLCKCRGTYYGSRCEIDGEVLGVAVGASVAAVVIIVLTLIFLCMWSRRWKAQDRKTEVLARGAAGATLGGFSVNVQHKGASGQQYGVTLEDRMRWAQLADTLSNQNIYAQQQQNEAVGGLYTSNSSDYLTSAATSASPFSVYNRLTRALSHSTLGGRGGGGGRGFLDRLRRLFGGSKTAKDRRPSYMMTPQPNISFQQLIALHARLAAQPEQLRGSGAGPSIPQPTAPTPTPLFQHQRQVGASSSGYASLGTLGSTSGGHFGHQLSPQQFGLQQLNPLSHLMSIQQQQQQQQQQSQHHLHRLKHGFGTQSTYGQFGPSSLTTLSQGGVSRAPTLGARTPLPLHDMVGPATIGPMGGASVAPTCMLDEEEEAEERPYYLPRPKSRASIGDASDIYYEPDEMTATRGPPNRPPPPVPRSSHPQTYNFSFLH